MDTGMGGRLSEDWGLPGTLVERRQKIRGMDAGYALLSAIVEAETLALPD